MRGHAQHLALLMRCESTGHENFEKQTQQSETAAKKHNYMNTRTRLPLVAALGCLVLESALAQPIKSVATNAPLQSAPSGLAENSIVLPSRFSDPIEPFNRAIWGFNKGFAISVVRPFSRGYRRVVVKPVRTGIGNMGKNLNYPRRLVNNLLQGNWAAMNDETERCFVNTLFGLGGFF